MEALTYIRVIHIPGLDAENAAELGPSISLQNSVLVAQQRDPFRLEGKGQSRRSTEQQSEGSSSVSIPLCLLRAAPNDDLVFVVPHHALVHGRHARENGQVPLQPALPHRSRTEARLAPELDAGARDERGEERDTETRGVMHRKHMQHDIAVTELPPAGKRLRVVRVERTLLQRSLGRARRARGEDDEAGLARVEHMVGGDEHVLHGYLGLVETLDDRHGEELGIFGRVDGFGELSACLRTLWVRRGEDCACLRHAAEVSGLFDRCRDRCIAALAL